MDKSATSTYPELLADLADQIASQLVERSIGRNQASDIGFAVAEYIREHWSGQSIYLPKGVHYAFDNRDIEIFDRFNGRNHVALAREYNLTVMRIYQIVKRVRAEMIKQRQNSLF